MEQLPVRAMTAYRVYALDADGLVVRARLIEARADEEAISTATELGWPRWQVWRGVRLVGDSAAGLMRYEQSERRPAETKTRLPS